MVKNLSKEVVLSYSGGSFVKDTHKCVTRLIRGRDMRQEAVVIILNSFLPPVLDSCFSASVKSQDRMLPSFETFLGQGVSAFKLNVEQV
jgi:hypothetical protein